MTISPLEAYDDHVRALSNGDIDEVVSGYAQDAVMVANGEIYRGRDAIRPLFERSRANSILDLDLITDVVTEGEVVYVSWRARRDGQPDLAGVDTFVITGGLITTHTGFYIPVE